MALASPEQYRPDESIAVIVEYRYKADKTDFPHFLQTGASSEIDAYREFWRVMEDIFDEADDVYIVGIKVED